MEIFKKLNCSSDLKIFANSRPSASNFKSFSRSLEHFFLIVGQNNFGNKIPFLKNKKKGKAKREKTQTIFRLFCLIVFLCVVVSQETLCNITAAE